MDGYIQYGRETSLYYQKRELVKMGCSMLRVKMGKKEEEGGGLGTDFDRNMFLYRTKLYQIINPGQASPSPAVSEMCSMIDCNNPEDPNRSSGLVISPFTSGGFTGIDINEEEAVFNKPHLGSDGPNEAKNADHKVFSSSPAYFFY